MGDIEEYSILKNLTFELSKARNLFRSYSLKVSEHNLRTSEELVDELGTLKEEIHTKTRVFTTTIRSAVDKIDHTWGYTEPLLDDLTRAGFILWIGGISASCLALFTSLLFLTSLSCDCCHLVSKARITLIISSSVVTVSSIILVFFIIFQLIIGGHAVLFICRPLYESPGYTVLTRLLDKPGLIYAIEPPNGMIGQIIKTPDVSSQQAAINVSISDAIGQCEERMSTYQVFDLEALLNLTNVVDLRNYEPIDARLNKLIAPSDPFHGLTNVLQSYLEEMVTDATVNLTSYRLELVQLTPEKDLITFIDQMQRVSLQVSNIAIHTFPLPQG